MVEEKKKPWRTTSILRVYVNPLSFVPSHSNSRTVIIWRINGNLTTEHCVSTSRVPCADISLSICISRLGEGIKINSKIKIQFFFFCTRVQFYVIHTTVSPVQSVSPSVTGAKRFIMKQHNYGFLRSSINPQSTELSR